VIARLFGEVVDGFINRGDDFLAGDEDTRAANHDLAVARRAGAIPGGFGLGRVYGAATIENMAVIGSEDDGASCSPCLVQDGLEVGDLADFPV
jgi:hypothetical protein